MDELTKLVVATGFYFEAKEKQWQSAVVIGNAKRVQECRQELQDAYEAKLDALERQLRHFVEHGYNPDRKTS